jgi:Suppressor of forked protein (Suf)
MDEPKRAKVDRFGRQLRQKANSPEPRTVKKTTSNKRELPAAIMDFLAALPPASMFDGATFHIDELIKLIRNARVPYPPGFVVDAKRARVDDEEDARGTKKISR